LEEFKSGAGSQNNYNSIDVSFQLLKSLKSFDTKSQCLDIDLNGKRPGVTSDGNFSSYLIGRS
jgi:hypothetical protein